LITGNTQTSTKPQLPVLIMGEFSSVRCVILFC